MKKYLLVHPDEDGNPNYWLDENELRELLADPEGTCSVTKFLEEIPKDTDANYWDEGTGLLLEVKVLKPVIGGYKIED